ncbi:MAG: nucleotidyl transferase AbiEii/AbiGii toxin family protein [Candidatus Cloacimonadales bacterium]|nr:nucleotidyl transferase AbiEii/AbiGii toxin family protein [Candidatus Cloacimonadales bacterium]
MIKDKCFELKWIKEIQKKNDRLNPIFIENMIYAFELLAELVKLDINFVFKGGTSLLLHFTEPRRLSIDIDIIGEFDLTILDEIIRNNPRFKSYKSARRIHNKPMIKNFEFSYDTALPNVDDQIVLLDLILAKPSYPKVKTKEIQSPLFESDEVLYVEVPSIESLLGDKLTAFAPNTIGIPLVNDQF